MLYLDIIIIIIIIVIIIMQFIKTNIYVVVNFLSQVIFIFPLFLGMAMHTNEVKTKKK